MHARTIAILGVFNAIIMALLFPGGLIAQSPGFDELPRHGRRSHERATLFRELHGRRELVQEDVSSMGSYEYVDGERSLWVSVTANETDLNLAPPHDSRRHLSVVVQGTDFSVPSDVQYLESLRMTLEDYVRIFASTEAESLHIPASGPSKIDVLIHAATVDDVRIVRVASTPTLSSFPRWRMAELTFRLRAGRFTSAQLLVLSRQAGSPLRIGAETLDLIASGLCVRDHLSGQSRFVEAVDEIRALLE